MATRWRISSAALFGAASGVPMIILHHLLWHEPFGRDVFYLSAEGLGGMWGAAILFIIIAWFRNLVVASPP